jgi:hypothetical protein
MQIRLTDPFSAELIRVTDVSNMLCPTEAQPKIAKLPIPYQIDEI